jgi:hypothetical protein
MPVADRSAVAMRVMWRWSVLAATVVALGLSAMWARSYFVCDRFSFDPCPCHDMRISSDLGHVTVFRVTTATDRLEPAAWSRSTTLAGIDPAVMLVESLVVRFEHAHFGQGADRFTRQLVVLPYWILVALAVALPLAGWLRSRRRARFGR